MGALTGIQEIRMAVRKKARPKLVEVSESSAAAPHRRNRVNLFELAYERIEDLIINCELKPGRFLAIQDLQEITGFSRTPVHQAVSRLADDLARERVLLHLRRDIERFVIRLAAERSGPSHRNQFLHLERLLRDRRESMTIAEFNVFDRRIDKLILAAASEPFLEHTMRPLHTIFRRIGWIHHNHIKGTASLHTTIDCHLGVLNAVANRHIDQAMSASDALIDFVDSMFDVMEREIDPALLDCSLEPLVVHPRQDPQC
jgi:DNA-binding GntR family transcriptional regulator